MAPALLIEMYLAAHSPMQGTFLGETDKVSKF